MFSDREGGRSFRKTRRPRMINYFSRKERKEFTQSSAKGRNYLP